MRLLRMESEKAPEPFNNPDLWIVKAVSNSNGLILGLIVRGTSNADLSPEEEVWSGFEFEKPWDMEFRTNTPEYKWVTSWVGEDSWRLVYNEFREKYSERIEKRIEKQAKRS